MTISRWDPIRDLMALQERMNRLFDQSLRARGEEEDFATGTWMPAVDIYETDDGLVIKAELPEVRKEDIEIKVEGGVLTLRGERKLDPDVKKQKYHRRERAYGVFSRSFSLPTTIDPDGVVASYHGGVLTISLPRLAETKPRQIEIT